MSLDSFHAQTGWKAPTREHLDSISRASHWCTWRETGSTNPSETSHLQCYPRRSKSGPPGSFEELEMGFLQKANQQRLSDRLYRFQVVRWFDDRSEHFKVIYGVAPNSYQRFPVASTSHHHEAQVFFAAVSFKGEVQCFATTVHGSTRIECYIYTL